MRSPIRLTVGQKVAMAPAAAVLCMVAISLLSIWSIHALTGSLEAMRSRTLTRLTSVADLHSRVLAVYAKTNQSLTWQGAEYPAERIAALDKEILAETGSIGNELTRQRQSPLWQAGEHAPLGRIFDLYQTYATATSSTLDMKSMGLGSATPFIDQMSAAYEPLNRLLTELAASERGHADGAVAFAVDRANRIYRAIAMCAVAAIVLAGAVGWYTVRRIVQPLARTRQMASLVAAGDLTARTGETAVDETGDVARALDDVALNLGNLVADVREAANEVALAANQLAQGNADLSTRTENQSARVQESASSIEQLTERVRANATDAEQAAALASEARSVGEEGYQAAREMLSTMEGLKTHSRRIAEIAALIDGVAFQTNLLALNAAVEAARAGEQGRGFSVVAAEVRTLATSVASAAKEIRDLVDASVQQTDVASSLATATEGTVSRLDKAIQQVNEMVRSIAEANRHQARDIDAINQGVSEMDTSTQQNAALVEEASAATASLSQQSVRLLQLLERFRIA